MEGLRAVNPDEGGGGDARVEARSGLDVEGVEEWMRNNNEGDDNDEDVGDKSEECTQDTG
jgi:hypothetical protein